MDSEFWIKAWNEGRTNFDQKSYNPKLLEYFPKLNPVRGQNVLVPLCGKSVDMLWFNAQGLLVHGVELYEKAVAEFFIENDLKHRIYADEKFRTYLGDHISISCGEYFKLGMESSFEFVYDRAALVALPESMRKRYVEVTTRALAPGGNYLLIVYEYDQTKLEGPPFSVSEKEIHELYGKYFRIKLMENQRPDNEGARLSETLSLTQKVYILEKKIN